MKLNSFVNVLLALALAPAGAMSSLGVTPSTPDVIAASVRMQTNTFPVADTRGPKKTATESFGVVTDAPSVLIRDVETGVTLMNRGDETVRPIASITKLMTALVLLDEYEWNWEDEATVLREDVTEGGRWYYRFGDSLTMEQLFSVMLVASGNNETLALVREVGADRAAFVQKMNAKAQAMGMTQTTFAGPIGLNPQNQSTANDALLLLHEALSRPEIASRVSERSVSTVSGVGNVYEIEGTNQLFSTFLNQGPYRVLGGKTGSLDEAGYCLATRVARDGQEVDIVVLGASQPDARFSDVQDVVSWVFDVYEWN